MELTDRLEKNSLYPFHMPGHKRNSKFSLPCCGIDITEIEGFDNLHNPEGILKRLQEEISDLFEYNSSIISVNGSTCCILAAISAICKRGDKIIIARNCHKSVYNACFLNELDVVYLTPEYDEELAAYTRISQESVDSIISQNPDAKALVITSPTYEGYISEINCDIPLIVDAAHGAHFGFADWLPQRAKADIVIQSLHKTLPSLTQTAVIHINNTAYYDRVKMYMDIFESSSPSYILLSSVDRCVDFLKNCNNDFSDYKLMLDDFYEKAISIENITLHITDDITRIIISADGYTGTELADHLRSCGIEPEGATLNYVILISTVGDTKKGFESLIKALEIVEKRPKNNVRIPEPALPKKVIKPCEIDNTAVFPLSECEGRICAQYIYAYPPGIPIIVPGEIMSREIIDLITHYINSNVNIIFDNNLPEYNILTKA